MIRKAVTQEVKPIHQLLGYYAEKGLLLPRSLSELYDHLRDLFVLVDEDQGDRVLGVCSLGVCWEDLAEIRSLVVEESHRGLGIGRQLVEACISEATSLGLNRIFALTYQVEFFERLGFRQVDKATLPHKIWADCIRCIKFPECDETALIIEP